MRCNLYKMTTEQAKTEYQKLFGHVNKQQGFSLTAKRIKSGVLVMKWYERNSWVEPELEKKVLFSNGKVFENHKQIGTYCCA